MNITVTFTDTGDSGMPEGRTLTFEGVSEYEVSTPAGIEKISCDEAGCKGCSSVHREFTGSARLILVAEGRRDALLWKDPEVVSA